LRWGVGEYGLTNNVTTVILAIVTCIFIIFFVYIIRWQSGQGLASWSAGPSQFVVLLAHQLAWASLANPFLIKTQ